MKPGDVILLNFPFSDLSAVKYPPAVVLAIAAHSDVIACLVTSQTVSHGISIDAASFASGGLQKSSVAVPDHLFTAHRSLIGKTVGRLNAAKAQEIRDAVVASVRKN